jgi:hypothetical protein
MDAPAETMTEDVALQYKLVLVALPELMMTTFAFTPKVIVD